MESFESFIAHAPDAFALFLGAVTSNPLASGALIVIGILALFIVMVPTAAQRHERRLLYELDAITLKLSEAEKIGKFGSFSWDFADPSLSYWSEEMYNLAGLVRRRKPPHVDVFAEIAHAEDRENVKTQWQIVREQPGPFMFVFRVVIPPGQARYLRVQGKSEFNIHKQLIIQGVAYDITKELQVDRAKSEFVSLASHQLKTPLTSIKWVAEALEKESTSLDSEKQKYIRTIRKESERMMGMVNDFLNVSRLELGTLIPQREEFDVGELAKSVVAEQQHTADEKKLTLRLTVGPSLPHLNGDKNLTRMVIQNLISNAIKYTPEQGTVTCELSTKGVFTKGVSVSVSDTGIGIPKDEQSHIFERLHRAANARSLVTDGTGLGLYLVKKIIDQTGGSVTFQSVEGKGTTFHAFFPAVWRTEDGGDT